MSKPKKAETTKKVSTPSPFITLPGSAFFDQELWEVVFNKLMKAPVKDYQVLLRLSKLWRTINDIAHELATKRDELAKEAGLEEYLDPNHTLTPEELNNADYQEKSKKFGELLQANVFEKTFSLEPLGTLTLDLTNPDGHAKAFLEGSSLSADDVMKLEESGIVKIVYPADTATKPVEKETLPAEEHITWAECVEWWEPVIHTDSEDLPAN